MPFAGDMKFSARSGDHGYWMLCDGRTISATQYAELVGIIGNRFGALGQLPDPRQKYLLGADPSVGSTELGDTGGSFTVALTGSNMPTLAVTVGSKTLATTGISTTAGGVSLITELSHAHTATPSFSGTGGAFSVVPPYLALNLFICWHTYNEPGV